MSMNLTHVERLLVSIVLTVLVAPVAAHSDTTPWPPAHVPGWRQFSYWDSRKIVTIAAYRSDRETLDSTVVIDNAGRAASADSIRRIVEHSLRKRKGDAVEYVQVALDSSARWFPGRQGIPDFAAGRLSSGHFHEWMRALDPQNPKRAQDGFIAQITDSIIGPGIRNALKGAEIANKATRGLLAWSPDSSYVLDPFAEVEISSSGAAMYDADDGYAVYDAKSGDILGWSVGAEFGFHLGSWISKDRFVLLGTMRADSPVRVPKTSLYVIVPIIYVGDMKRRVGVTYLGRAIDAGTTRLGHAQSAAYPKVKW
jgi:hypothetical protein